MENIKASTNAEQQHESKVDEAENFDTFIKAMVQIVEKYGRFVLQELDSVAQVYATVHIIFLNYRRWQNEQRRKEMCLVSQSKYRDVG